MESEYQRGYSSGYYRGSRGTWPDHRPPQPPNETIAALMEATMNLRNAVDAELATLDGDDEWTERLGPLVDAVDEQFEKIGHWLRNEAAEAEDGTIPA